MGTRVCHIGDFIQGCDIVPFAFAKFLWLPWSKISVRDKNGGSREGREWGSWRGILSRRVGPTTYPPG